MNIQLTISLLASSRIESLKRCLDSLLPLLSAIPSELIVVFTGTDERVRQTALAYTDQVIPFSWCDDFSAARNAALPYAKGEWFMFIDDDEWFEDCSELIRFFKSGDYRRYNSAHYIVRNYQNWSGTAYVDGSSFRLAKRGTEMKFVFPTHESLSPHYTPIKFFKSYVHHYGYVKDPGAPGKSTRNIPMLLRDIEKAPTLSKNYYQLTREYIAENRLADAQECCEKGLAACGEKEFWLEILLVEVLGIRGDCQQSFAIGEKLLKKKELSEIMRLSLHHTLLQQYLKREEYEQSLAHGQRFEKLFKRMTPEKWKNQQYLFYNYETMAEPMKLASVRVFCAKAALSLPTPDLSEAQAFLSRLPWKDEKIIQKSCGALLEQLRQKFPENFGEVIRKLPPVSPYLYLLHAREYQKTNPSKAEKLLAQALKSAGKDSPCGEILQMALETDVDFSEMREHLKLSEWSNAALSAVNRLPIAKVQTFFSDGSFCLPTEDLNMRFLEILLREKVLFQGYLSKEDLLAEMETYSRCTVRFYKKQYPPECFESEYAEEILPGRYSFAAQILEGIAAAKDGHFADAVRNFRESLKWFSGMASVITEASRYLAERSEDIEKYAGEEFRQLSVQMKAALRELCANGQYKEALPIVAKLLEFMPEDLELLRRKQEILRKMP